MSVPIVEEKAQASHVYGVTYFDGSLLTVNGTPGFETTTWRHTSGSSVKFCPDGTISIIAAKEIHVLAKGTETNTIRLDGALNAVVNKEHHFKCHSTGDIDYSGHVRRSCKTLKETVQKECVVVAESLSFQISHRWFCQANALDTETYARTDKIGGPWMMESDSGIGLKNTNPNGGLYLESAGYMTCNVVKNYNTTVTQGKINVTASANKINVTAAKEITVQGKKIYLN